MSYAELATASNFSFLRGASHPGELVARAAALGLSGLGICDRNSLAGVVRGHVAMRKVRETHPEFRYVVGARLVFSDSTPEVIAYPTDRAAYGRLSAMLTQGNRRAIKGDCILKFADLQQFHEGLLFIVVAENEPFSADEFVLRALSALAPGRVWLGVACKFKGRDRGRLNALSHVAQNCGVPLIAINDVQMHVRERQILQDVLTCIRLHLTIHEAGKRLEQNAERCLKSPREMARLFVEHPGAIDETQRLLDRITFSLDELRYNYPEETIGNGETAQQTLERCGGPWRARRSAR